MSANLLVEIFTEELPPKALKSLGTAFADGITSGLASRGLLAGKADRVAYATPRRLAVKIANVLDRSLDRPQSKKLMPSKLAYGADGKPTQTLLKRLEKEGYRAGYVPEDGLERRIEGDAEYVFHNQVVAGSSLQVGLQSALEDTIEQLPIPRSMSYQLADGATTVQFVRPAHGLVALHGSEVVPVSVLGLEAGRITHGHRVQGVKDITVAAADAYEEALAAHGQVIASFDARRAEIGRQLADQAATLKTSLGPEADYAPLLDEVTGLVEFPTVYTGKFEKEFLAVPQECLILTMRQNQKYFPLFDIAGKLTNKFLIVSNMRLADPKSIVEGNQRVILPRLADARFFFETDKKTRLEERVPRLASIVYHNKLGNQLERAERVQLLAGSVARAIGADTALAERAAWLAKADLITNMVGEFPELQGIMGRYYALADGEPKDVAEAIGDQYRIRRGEDESPENLVSMSLYIADRAETLVGIWGIGLQPTGDKDPFGLRRAALGLIGAFQILGATSAITGRRFALSVNDLFEQAATEFKPGVLAQDTVPKIIEFVYERYRNQLAGLFNRSAVDAVIALQPPLHEVVPRVKAVIEFGTLPEAAALAAANKRIHNILKQAKTTFDGVANTALLNEEAERVLYREVKDARQVIDSKYDAREYTESLKALAKLRPFVDNFFDKVLVNTEDPEVRQNRLRLLGELNHLMNRVADISMLAA